MFMLFEFMFPIIFVIVFGMIIFQFVTGIGTWHKNNQSPRLSVSATVVAKRENVSHHSHPNGGDPSGAHGYHTTSSTSYYVTFQVESGDRLSFTERNLPSPSKRYGPPPDARPPYTYAVTRRSRTTSCSLLLSRDVGSVGM